MYKESLFGGFVAFDASVGIGFALAVAGVFFLSFDVNTVFSLSTEPVSTASKRSSCVGKKTCNCTEILKDKLILYTVYK